MSLLFFSDEVGAQIRYKKYSIYSQRSIKGLIYDKNGQETLRILSISNDALWHKGYASEVIKLSKEPIWNSKILYLTFHDLCTF